MQETARLEVADTAGVWPFRLSMTGFQSNRDVALALLAESLAAQEFVNMTGARSDHLLSQLLAQERDVYSQQRDAVPEDSAERYPKSAYQSARKLLSQCPNLG